VTFDIDANGILNVSAKDKATNKEQKITIQSSTGLTKEEAEKMRTEAESHAEDDRRRMEEVEARNRLDGIVYQAEKMVRENRDKIGEADAKSLEAGIEDAKKAMSEGEGGTARLRSATENIERELHKVAEVLYKSSQAAGAAQAGAAGAGAGAGSGSAPGGGSQPQKKPDDVIDAEYVDVDESKRPN